jgi:[ribosomal protein S18]-alanine N-acetyltransferase
VKPRVDIAVERLRRPVTAEDRDAVIAIETESFANPWTIQTFDAMLDTPVSEIFVARDDGRRVVAFCACWLIGDELHINTIAVRTPLRRQGLAYELLRRVFDLTGANRATLEVRRSNVAALVLYERLGFAVTGVRSNYYQHPDEDGLILWRNP